MTRYRLRFLLQEFDLPRGATILGRSSDCHVTIEDPLVSRHHARIVLDGDRAVIHDLGSRNGVKVNGVPIRGPLELRDGDRLRIGTQELVFCRVEAVLKASAKTTGFLRHCASCRMPYAQEAGSCPNCGSADALDEETLTGQFGPDARNVWSLQLFLEVLDRAFALGRFEDAARILKRATTQVEEHIGRGDTLDRAQLAQLAIGATRASLALGDITWGLWVAKLYEQLPTVAPVEVVAGLGDVGARFPSEMAGPLDRLAEHSRNIGVVPDDVAVITALERVNAALAPLAEAAKPILS